ncbi:MAG: ATPase [Chloroflexi bacterium]|nr:ATPase [Chloroflexota bacterium]
MEIERVPTGVPGLDELIEGGLPRGRTVLVSGTAGSGKTTLGVQFLYDGVTRHGESGLFVTLQEELPDLAQDMARYGWDIDALSQQGKLGLIQSPVMFEISQEKADMDSILDMIHKRAMEIDARRIVFDSIAQLGLPYADPVALRRDLMRLGALLRELGCTTLLITEMPDGGQRISRYGVEEFLAQGVVLMHFAPTYRAIQIAKLRGTKHDTGIHKLRMTEKGIVVSPGEKPF